jgi:hypothetical protein
LGAYAREVRRATMSQNINSKVAAGVGPAEPALPGSASTGLESSPVLDLCTLVGDLADAISVVTVVYRSLAALEIPAVADEETALRHALGLLRSAYTALDVASCRAS